MGIYDEQRVRGREEVNWKHKIKVILKGLIVRNG